MKFLAAIAFLVLGSQCLAESLKNSDHYWARYKELHGKSYNGEEDQLRKSVFEENLEMIVKHNLEYELGLHSYKLGISHLTDMFDHELSKMVNGLALSERDNHEADLYEPSGDLELPSSLDWRDKGYVTGVKDQGQCGSCWAFSAVGSLEGQHYRKTGKLVSLSEQNLVDCSTENGNGGCGGGLMDNAFKYVMRHGIDTEESYPYDASYILPLNCRFNASNVGATCKGYKDIPKNEKSLQMALVEIGPISVVIDASHKSFTHYKGGIYDEPLCHTITHAVVLVGYGTENGKDYWLVKNSISEAWGEKGYMRMVRNKNNQCGIAKLASYPIV